MDQQQVLALLQKISANILRARDLSEVKSKEDPETNPYKSKYEARKIIKDVLADIEEEMNVADLDEVELEEATLDGNQTNEDSTRIGMTGRIILAALESELGVNFVETEEVTTGEEHFESSLNYLAGGNPLSPFKVSLLIAIKCQIGIIWSNRSDHNKSLSYFKEAETLFEQYKATTGVAPVFHKDILLTEETSVAKTSQEREVEFENQHTLTLYYIAQSLNNLGERENSGKYCHITLQRQMETRQYEPMDWAINCATLSQFYITKDMYNFARYCLACALMIGEEALEKFNPEDYDESEVKRAEEKVMKMEADIARCWAKYCLNLLISSHQKRLNDSTQRENQVSSSGENQASAMTDDLKHLKFKGLEVTSLEEQVLDKLAETYDEARSVFLCGQKWLQKAKDFYIFDGYVSDFVEINQDLSQLFKYLSFFDDSFERRCKMHKRRIDILNAPLLELNPKHFLQICRQLTFEIGETYSDMADLKKAIMEEDSSKVNADNIRKFNKLLLQGVKFYQGFIDSYKHMDKHPEKYEDDAVRGVLLAYFYMARLHSKYLTPERRVKGEHMMKEKDCYDTILNYCDNHSDMPNVFEEELAISREMVALFPAKINQVLDA